MSKEIRLQEVSNLILISDNSIFNLLYVPNSQKSHYGIPSIHNFKRSGIFYIGHVYFVYCHGSAQ